MLGGMAGIMGLAALRAFFSPYHEPKLLERATRIATLKQDYPDSLWLSSHEVLLTSPSQHDILVDTTTGRQQPVNTNTEAMAQRMGRAPQRDQWLQDMRISSYLAGGPIKLTIFAPKKRRQVQAIQSHLPKPAGLEGFATSPDGKREASLLQVWRMTFRDHLGHFMRRFLPPQGTHQSDFVLCVSDPNGGNMQEIAWEPIPDSLLKPRRTPLILKSGQLVPWPHNLQLTLDGKHVSFLYKDALWTVPVG